MSRIKCWSIYSLYNLLELKQEITLVMPSEQLVLRFYHNSLCLMTLFYCFWNWEGNSFPRGARQGNKCRRIEWYFNSVCNEEYDRDTVAVWRATASFKKNISHISILLVSKIIVSFTINSWYRVHRIQSYIY